VIARPQPLPPPSRRAEETETTTASEASSYSVAQDLTRANGARQTSIYNSCHKSPDAEELETATAAQPLPDAEELDRTAVVGASAPYLQGGERTSRTLCLTVIDRGACNVDAQNQEAGAATLSYIFQAAACDALKTCVDRRIPERATRDAYLVRDSHDRGTRPRSRAKSTH